ncbi:MAG: hypothetical protein V7765_15960 [Oleispira sp.]
MLEQQRIEYLQAMGIQLWMPRQALDNAAESTWLADSLSDSLSSDATGSGTQIQAGHAADLLADMGLADVTAPITNTPVTAAAQNARSAVIAVPKSNQVQTGGQVVEPNSVAMEELPVDLTVPKFELHFALWPCGILWVSGQAFEQQDHGFQTAVSYSLLGNTVPQASYSQFKWPYIEGSHEDQSMAVALRALTAQWEFMSSQGARGWVATDASSLQWLGKVAAKALYSVDERSELYSSVGKKQLWSALQTLSNKQVS